MIKPIDLTLAYADGGVIGRNPSKLGGTWAYRLVNSEGICLVKDQGIVTPEMAGLPTITNNLMELYAVLKAMQYLPDGWKGSILTDSQVTVYRISRTMDLRRFQGIPVILREELRKQRKRLGRYTTIQVGGHPTEEDLERGHNGKSPVSLHNVYCDLACQEASAAWRGE
jgi:ribonuclease HI